MVALAGGLQAHRIAVAVTKKTKTVPTIIIVISVLDGFLETAGIVFVALEDAEGAVTGARDALAADGVKVGASSSVGAAVLFVFC